ncbi:peptidoglycan-binding protein [Amycolatopsis antarctica]|uniref:Peptidoglycan-binding protein n=1 Tax=Amycolatopsis antarctica TaxID=1854586 RepID=A0A263D867_9PSEU|nr:peptidoglycan-binding domain-containing protein [Amycolatopsis antarctica]OZM74680.1 peptidoglycan-binding protein [Amycolatopsis antarctica]
MNPKRAGLAALAAVVVTAGAPAVASGSPDSTLPDSAETLPQVDMEMVLKAAQIDPRRADQAPTPGAKDSVMAVEQALRANGLLDQERVDGHYGTETVLAYAGFQRSLGHEGMAASGFPGIDSLRRLSENRFEITRTVVPGERSKSDGETVNARTKAMLAEAERLTEQDFTLEQGSYNPGGDPTSAGTHDGGGVVDIDVHGMDAVAVTESVEALRRVGFAAWHRTEEQGDWPAHIHAAAISDPDLSTPAQHQPGDYYLGRNGLADQGADDGPPVKPIRTWEEYRRAN